MIQGRYGVVALAAAWLLGAPAAHAYQVFSEQAAFLSATGALSVETFEDAPNLGAESTGGLEMIDFDGFVASSGLPKLKVRDVPDHGNHNITPDGLKYLVADADIFNTPMNIILTFESALGAIGFWLIDIDLAPTLDVVVGGQTFSVAGGEDGSETFFGLRAENSAQQFTVVTIQNPVSGVEGNYSIDDVHFRVIPEPGTLFLFSGGLLGLALLRRRG